MINTDSIVNWFGIICLVILLLGTVWVALLKEEDEDD